MKNIKVLKLILFHSSLVLTYVRNKLRNYGPNDPQMATTYCHTHLSLTFLKFFFAVNWKPKQKHVYETVQFIKYDEQ